MRSNRMPNLRPDWCKNTMIYSGMLGWRTDRSDVQYSDARNVSILACPSPFFHANHHDNLLTLAARSHTPPFPHSALICRSFFLAQLPLFPLCFAQHLDGCHDIVSFMFRLSFMVKADKHLNMYIHAVVLTLHI